MASSHALQALRARLILSHLLPTLIIIPLIGLALVYVLETQVLLVNLSDELMAQAVLVAEMANQQAGIWNDPGEAGAFVARMSPRLTARVMLLDAHGYLLASSDPADTQGAGQQISVPGLANALAGQTDVRVNYGQVLYAEVADVLIPIVGPDQQVIGIVRMTHQLANIYQRFLRLRSLILGVLVAGLLQTASLGFYVAAAAGTAVVPMLWAGSVAEHLLGLPRSF